MRLQKSIPDNPITLSFGESVEREIVKKLLFSDIIRESKKLDFTKNEIRIAQTDEKVHSLDDLKEKLEAITS